MIRDALTVEPAAVFELPNRGHELRASDVGICHPDLGWGRVDVMNAEQFRCRFETALVWFSLASAEVAQWPITNAVELARWTSRVRNVASASQVAP